MRNGDPPMMVLRSGRMINTTESWNPFVFSFVYDHFEVLKYFVEHKHKINLRMCFQCDDIYKFKTSDFDPDEGEVPQEKDQKHRFHSFLTILVENRSSSIYMLFDQFYHMIEMDDLLHVFNVLSQLPSSKCNEHKI